MNNSVVVYASKESNQEFKQIEIEHFTFCFQDAYNNNEIAKCYLEGKKIVAVDAYGEILTDII